LKNLSQQTQGFIYAILAFSFWGLVPIYFKALSSVSPAEVLAHRIIWSVVLLFGIILFTRQFGALKILTKDIHKIKYLVLSSLLVSTNWLVFIWAVSNNMLTEASLGYYINPLVNFALGVLFFKERPNIAQTVAIVLALLAIVYQVLTIGSLPIVSLVLAFSFAFYGLVRKKVNIPSVTGLYIETLILFPLALLYFIYLVSMGTNAFTLPLDTISTLLLLAGVITVVPLLWFNSAATKISLIHIGFFQYIGPTISFSLAVFVYDEPFSKEKLVTFVLIWLALLVFSVDAYRRRKK
jgi:chloramphenicol-sensitive protein RarD